MGRSKSVQWYLGLAAALFVSWLVLAPAAHADETAGEKVQSAADAAGKSMKKAGRKVRKSVRDTTGSGSVTEDAKAAVNNTSDAVETKVKKMKRKAD